jgi:hypothetical protein
MTMSDEEESESRGNVWSNQWRRSLIPGRVVLSSRKSYVTQADGPGLYVEEIVLESQDNLTLEDRGTEMVLPIRKRR